MAGEWATGTLRDAIGEKGYIRGPFGSALRRPELQSSGVPVYEQQHAITGTREFRFYIDEEKYKALKRFTVQPDDLIISCSGTLARVSMIGPEDPMGIISQALLILRPDTAVVWPEYFYYVMSSKRGYDSLVGVSTGSVQVNIAGRAIIEKTELPLPPLADQRAIAHILGTLDDKIELNRRMSETLESIARALFKSWFVDFDPVRAKAEGRETGLPAHIAELFPDSFEDSELGEIPRGWGVGPILDHARLISGGTPKTDRPEYWDGPIAWASAKDVSQSRGSILVDTERTITELGLDESATQVVPAFCSAVVARGATTGRMVLFGRDMAMNQTCYALATTTETPVALYCRLRQEIDGLVHAAHGSVFDTITTSTFASSRIVLPPLVALRAFEERAAPVFARVLRNIRESRTLTTLRDMLLPKLISGELQVGDAIRGVAGVNT